MFTRFYVYFSITQILFIKIQSILEKLYQYQRPLYKSLKRCIKDSQRNKSSRNYTGCLATIPGDGGKKDLIYL